MSSCYSVTLELSFRTSRRAASATLRHFIATNERVNFALDRYAQQGVHTRSFDDLMRIFLAGWRDQPVTITRLPGNRLRYDNAFNDSCGWERVLLDMFTTLAPHFANGSSLTLFCDGGTTTYKAQKGILT